MTRTLITGAGGFTGRYLSSLLANRGHEVHGLVHTHAGDVPGATCLYEADLADLPAVQDIVDEAQPDYIVHLAAIAFIAHADVAEMYRSNVVGTRQLLEAVLRLKKTPQSIILASSANIYGNAREGVLDEEMFPAPANDYGVSKVAVENIAALYRGQLPLIVVRPFNYTGRGQSPDFLIPKIVDHARDRAPFIELGNLDVARDFSDVRDVTEIYARLLAAPMAIGGTYNVCSGQAVTLEEVIRIVTRLSGHRFEVRINPAFVRSNEVRTLTGSLKKLEGVLGHMDRTPLEGTVSWMLEA